MNREELIEEAANAMSQGYVQDGRISSFCALAEAALAVFEKAQAPTDDERGALPIVPREIWGWDTCVVCGSKEVSDRGMVIMGASKGSPYVARIAWCDQSQECREDLRQTSFLLTEFEANMIDQPEGDKGVTHAALRAAFTAGREPTAEALPRGKSCAADGCRHAARWQDSGSVDWCACHYDDSAPDEECAAGQGGKP